MPSSSDQLVKVYLVWGVKPQDMTSCHFSDISCTGKSVLDTNFDLNSASAQLGLARLCRTLQNPSQLLRERLLLYENPETNASGVNCFVTGLETYLAVRRSLRQGRSKGRATVS